MKTFNEEEFAKDWGVFCTNLEKAELKEKFNLEKLESNFKMAAGGCSEDTGIAYPGALLSHINLFTAIAQRIAKLVSGTFTVDEKSLLKVCLLMHMSKIQMFEPNDNEWRVKNLGENYKFAELEGNLKFGERSIYICSKSGILFSPTEWEAMECLDKAKDNNNTKYVECILSTIVRQANELAYAIEKEKNKRI